MQNSWAWCSSIHNTEYDTHRAEWKRVDAARVLPIGFLVNKTIICYGHHCVFGPGCFVHIYTGRKKTRTRTSVKIGFSKKRRLYNLPMTTSVPITHRLCVCVCVCLFTVVFFFHFSLLCTITHTHTSRVNEIGIARKFRPKLEGCVSDKGKLSRGAFLCVCVYAPYKRIWLSRHRLTAIYRVPYVFLFTFFLYRKKTNNNKKTTMQPCHATYWSSRPQGSIIPRRTFCLSLDSSHFEKSPVIFLFLFFIWLILSNFPHRNQRITNSFSRSTNDLCVVWRENEWRRVGSKK